eukprot:4516890-Prymnesium_polylepis.2
MNAGVMNGRRALLCWQHLFGTSTAWPRRCSTLSASYWSRRPGRNVVDCCETSRDRARVTGQQPGGSQSHGGHNGSGNHRRDSAVGLGRCRGPAAFHSVGRNYGLLEVRWVLTRSDPIPPLATSSAIGHAVSCRPADR